MTARRHDDEPDTGPEIVRALLRQQAPDIAGLPIDPLSNGSDNALYRLGTDFVIRLPRFADAAGKLDVELGWLPRLSGLPVAVPEVVHVGISHELYPFSWAVLRWLDGTDAWDARQHRGWFGSSLGHDLAALVRHLRRTAVENAPVRKPGERSGSLHALDDRVRWWVDRADGLIDVRAVLRLWEECLEGAEDGVEHAGAR